VIDCAVVLVGGRGTRLGSLTDAVPKPMLPIEGHPFLEYVVRDLHAKGMRRIVLAAGYQAEKIEEFFAGRAYGAEVDVVTEESPKGTGGALYGLEDRLPDAFAVLNGDTVFDISYQELERFRRSESAEAAIALRWVEDRERYGGVESDGPRIVSFTEKGRAAGPGWISGGMYVLSREVFAYIRPECSLEADVFPALARSGTLVGLGFDSRFLDFGVPEAYAEADAFVKRWWRKPIAFLDRDGVINVDSGHCHSPEDFVWMPGAREAIKLLNDNGFRVVVVTNQAGIAKGYYGVEEFHLLHRWIDEQLAKVGAYIDAVYHCPHHPEGTVEGLAMSCGCRKPMPGLLEQAFADWESPPEDSFLVGDSPADVEAARRVGVRGFLYDGGRPLNEFVRDLISTPSS
jgi:D,D-heptose 1,7-bisphosphate phosphatase